MTWPVLAFSAIGTLSLLVIVLGSKGLLSSPVAMFYVLQLAALGLMFWGGMGMRSGAPGSAAILYGAAAAWLLGNAQYLPIIAYPQIWFSLTGLTIGAMILGIPLLATCGGMCCKLGEDA